MTERSDGEALANIAGAIADASRATMLLALLDRRAWTATELAKHAGIARSTATEHLNVLAGAGLIEERRQGRHRYVRIVDQTTAAMIESLSSRTPPTPPRATWRAADADRALRHARTCFDHIAGELGTRICAAFHARGLLESDGALRLSAAGRRWCAEHEIDVDGRASRRRPEVMLCLDWTERRDHLAGALGAALLDGALAANWVERTPHSRALKVTPRGDLVLRAGLERR